MEKLRPIPNKINFVRLFADLQVCSTYRLLKAIVKEMTFPYINKAKVLDVGCGDSPYKFLFQEYEYLGIDWENSDNGFDYKRNDVIYYDGLIFPIQEETQDIVIHTEVAEHIPQLNLFFSECYRVLKRKGIMVFSIPFSARYHYIPYDYRRLTPAGIKLYLEKAGFEQIEIFPRGTDITVACYKVVTIGYRWLLSKRFFNIIGCVLGAPLFVVFLLLGQLSLWRDIGQQDDCLGYVVRAVKE